MSAQLLLAPVGAGKTEAALDRLIQVTSDHPFEPVWVLLATERQVDAFRRRLLRREGRPPAVVNVHFFNFYSLSRHLLHVAGQPQRCLDEIARLRLLRAVLLDLRRQGQLPIYGEIARTQGFVRVVGDLIAELKQHVVDPDAFAAAARSEKDVELAAIYRAYQAALHQAELVDRDGEGWVALDALSANPALGRSVALLLVDGYDQFNPLQAQLLAALASRARETMVTLTTVPGREATIGRRFQRARDRLATAFAGAGVPLAVTFGSARHDERPLALRHLGEAIFLPDSVPVTAGPALSLIEAPDTTQEAAAILRRVKRLLLAGTPPDDILIAVRDWALYAEPLATAASNYGLSSVLAFQYSEPLRENPAVVALLDLLDLHAGDFRRRPLLDVLSSPYFEIRGLDGEWIGHLDRVSRALRVTGGAETWLEAVRMAVTTRLDPEDEQSPTVLTVEAAEHLEYWLEKFFTRVTPPASASVPAYVRWLEMLIGPDPERDPDDQDDLVPPDVSTLNMIGKLRRPAPHGIVERDLAALARLKDVLRGFIAVQQLLDSLAAEDMIPWASFMADLRAAVASTTVQRAPAREGRVLVTTVADARGLPHRHVFVPGLSEGVFPARLSEDPLYTDTERRALSEAGIPLQPQAERADDDGLFYEIVNVARESLTLSRSYVQDGSPWPASHLWRGVLRLFEDADQRLERIPIGAVVPAAEAASLSEAALAVADALGRHSLDADTGRLYNWLVTANAGYWMHINRGRTVEAGRMDAEHPFDRYAGRLSHPALIAHLNEMHGPSMVWSATQLNDMGLCAFRYFAGRLLELETVEEPGDGMTVLQAGLLAHAILEETYRQVQIHGMAVEPAYVEEAVSMLGMIARDILRDAPRRFGFQASALWEQEKRILLRKLEALVRADFSDQSPLRRYAAGRRVPYQVEAAFGFAGEDALTIPVGGADVVRVRGKIDRLDRAGDTVIVVDYKSGGARINREELERGRNFQMLLYFLAAEDILRRDTDNALSVGAGVFWHIGSREIVGDLLRDADGEAAIDKARALLGDIVLRARQGDFRAHANKLEEGRCARYCEFHTFCRVSSVNQRKPQELAVDEANG